MGEKREIEGPANIRKAEDLCQDTVSEMNKSVEQEFRNKIICGLVKLRNGLNKALFGLNDTSVQVNPYSTKK